MKVFLVAGARPNFMKIAPIYRASLAYEDLNCRIIHTGQHYDHEMSEAFFKDLEIPRPDYFLNVGSGSHAVQTAKIMVEFESLCQADRPDLVMVVGDVNSTLACSIVAKKLSIDVAHVEAGLRSLDLSMPEEINRMVTDAITDHFFVTEESGEKNLVKEGKSKDKIHFVGNVMIDNLFYNIEKMKADNETSYSIAKIKQKTKDYAFLTLHRPSNVDNKDTFSQIVEALNMIAKERTIFFPVHPRTQKSIQQFKMVLSSNIITLPPLGFKESLFLWKDAQIVLTDSGGLQEETTALGVPCITLRENTERPITIDLGTNRLAGTRTFSILAAYQKSINKKTIEARIPPKWDGKAAERIWQAILG